jgi:hypothetical protein
MEVATSYLWRRVRASRGAKRGLDRVGAEASACKPPRRGRRRTAARDGACGPLSLRLELGHGMPGELLWHAFELELPADGLVAVAALGQGARTAEREALVVDEPTARQRLHHLAASVPGHAGALEPPLEGPRRQVARAEQPRRDVEAAATTELAAELSQARTIELDALPQAYASRDVQREGTPAASIDLDRDAAVRQLVQCRDGRHGRTT